VNFLEKTPLLFLGFVAAALAGHWASIPERYPVHFDLLGRADRFADRSWVATAALLAAGFLGVVGLWALRRLLEKSGVSGAAKELAGGAALGAGHALAAVCGAAAARPLWASPGPLPLLVGAGMSFLFLPAAVAIARSKGPAPRPRERPAPGTTRLSARRLLLVVAACGALGAAAVLARLPRG